MVVGEDAKLTAYFFTTYGEASRLLKVARNSSDRALAQLKAEVNASRKVRGEKPIMGLQEEMEEIGTNPWKEATISTVPLDFAVTLANRGKIGGAYFKLAPEEEDINDALIVDSMVNDLAEGKVPLFYFEEFQIPDSKGKMQRPLFFRKKELLTEWKRYHPGKQVNPVVKVTELFAVLTKMLTPGEADPELKDVMFVPPTESLLRSNRCIKAFKMGERIVVL